MSPRLSIACSKKGSYNQGMKEYSHLDRLPKGHSSGKITDGCLICEGGGWRGVYTQGVLDALMEADISLQCTIGVSAGALMSVNYLTGQIGRGPYITLKYRHDPHFVGIDAIRENHGIAGFKFMHETVEDIWPGDYERFYDPSRRFVCVATSCLDGLPRYFEKGIPADDPDYFWKGMQAGASVPYASRMVRIREIPYLDGGVSDPIPLDWAISQGYEKIVVIRTQMKGFRKARSSPRALCRIFYGKYPRFCDQLSHTKESYNAAADKIEDMEKQGRLRQICPSRNIQVPLFSGDMEKLGELYWMGYDDCRNDLPALKEYLGA